MKYLALNNTDLGDLQYKIVYLENGDVIISSQNDNN